tara:strand:- start:217 stop:792 length:576 start_codon:yes stop_codon:yes gene_type:complete
MKKYSGRKVFVAVFISGRGSNLKSLINFSEKKISPIKIDVVFSNNKNAIGLKFAKEKKIKIIYLKEKNFYFLEQRLVKILNKRKIELICLAGFMKILSKSFIKKFNGKIINIHPSLLPKYKGLNTHRRVIENNENYTGCTVHFVNSKLDSGKIIFQKKIKIFKKDNEKTLAQRVLLEEHKLYPKAIMKLLS